MEVNWSLDWVKLQAELNYQKVAPTVTYQDIAISILLDVTSKNQRVIDSVNFTEAFDLNLIRPVSDEVILSDSVVKYVIKDYFGDTVSLDDILGTFNIFLRDKFEEIHASDLESDALINTSLINEFVLNSAVRTNSQVAVTPTKTDGIDLTTILDIFATATDKIFSDIANISDGTTSNISKYLASGLSLNDSANVNTSVTESADNIATMSDTISVSLILSRMLGSTTINEITLN